MTDSRKIAEWETPLWLPSLVIAQRNGPLEKERNVMDQGAVDNSVAQKDVSVSETEPSKNALAREKILAKIGLFNAMQLFRFQKILHISPDEKHITFEKFDFGQGPGKEFHLNLDFIHDGELAALALVGADFLSEKPTVGQCVQGLEEMPIRAFIEVWSNPNPWFGSSRTAAAADAFFLDLCESLIDSPAHQVFAVLQQLVIFGVTQLQNTSLRWDAEAAGQRVNGPIPCFRLLRDVVDPTLPLRGPGGRLRTLFDVLDRASIFTRGFLNEYVHVHINGFPPTPSMAGFDFGSQPPNSSPAVSLPNAGERRKPGPRPKNPEADKQLVEEFKRSGLTRRDFLANRGLDEREFVKTQARVRTQKNRNAQ